MNLEQLTQRFRTDSCDKADPPFASNEEVWGWFSQAVDEAAIRARLLLEDSDPAFCRIAVSAGQSRAPLHPKTYEIAQQSFVLDTGRHIPLDLISREKLDQVASRWREMPNGEPRWLIQMDTSARLVPAPMEAGALHLEIYRLSLKPLLTESSKPEIHEARHIHLVEWALHKFFSIPDADFFDTGRAQRHLQNFENYFGLSPDVDLRRSTREDEVQTTVVHTF